MGPNMSPPASLGESHSKDRDSESALDKQDQNIGHIPSEFTRYAWFKMDLVILPVISMFYFLSFLVSSMPFGPLSEREMRYLRPWDAIS